MATTYASPGVYVEEVERGTKPIESAGASIAAFVGITARAASPVINASGEVEFVSVTGRPIMISNWTQYTETFGGFADGIYTPDAVYGYFNNGGGVCYVLALQSLEELEASSSSSSSSSSSKSTSAKAADSADDKKSTPAKSSSSSSKSASSSALTPADYVGNAGERTGFGGLEPIDEISLLICPDLFYGYDDTKKSKDFVRAVQTEMIAHCENMRYRFALLDTPPNLNAQGAKEWREFVNFDTSYAAMYYPWIEVPNLSGEGALTKVVPPSGHVVGIYNRSDGERGVHKAPANEVIRGAVDVGFRISKGEQDVLNPIGVNCIRVFPGRGIRVWGARTLSSNGAWRYINVRRLFNLVGESLDRGLQWVVFEPNDTVLWALVRRDISSFLRVLWQGGALFGGSPSEAFYVKIDEELNPPEIRDLGQLIIEVGLAPVKPAEFVILRLSQWAGANAE